MTFQRISFREKRGCVASGQPGAGPGIDVGGGGGGRERKKTDNLAVKDTENISIKILASCVDKDFVFFLFISYYVWYPHYSRVLELKQMFGNAAGPVSV